ncbi:GNAT family protein [Flavobacterium enshiense]|uniref:GNAT family N-acetyltransferase n=1 Tax=Flavobacterium enshiense TaxID=1341165 RepID=UPI00345DA185
MTIETITTENLLLRKLTPEVYNFIFNTFSEADIIAFLGLESQTDFSKEKDKFEKGLTTYNRSFVNFQIIEKSSNEIIGACGFHTWYTEHARAEIGYALKDDRFKGKGVMTEALSEVIAYGFNTMKLNRIEAFIGTNNVASLKLVAKMGFSKEGLLRQHYCKNNFMEDSVVFSLLKSEYLQ